MDANHAMDDLKTIRKIMTRTRQSAGGEGGWIMVMWGCIWFIGFMSSQFLSPDVAGWVWFVIDALGFIGTVVIARYTGRRNRLTSSVWRAVFLWWFVMIVFDVVIIWMFDISMENVLLLVILTLAFSFIQFGLFSHWVISAMGVLWVLIVTVTTSFAPDYFHLMMGLVGGGSLIGGGLWLVRKGE
jgi:hypothetical protein